MYYSGILPQPQTTLQLRATGQLWRGHTILQLTTTPPSVTDTLMLALLAPAFLSPLTIRYGEMETSSHDIDGLCFQKLSDADKLYSSSAAAAYMSDPRLCAGTALRLATPDNKHGKPGVGDDGAVVTVTTADNVDKLIPVKEESEPCADMTTEYVVTSPGGGDHVRPWDHPATTDQLQYMCTHDTVSGPGTADHTPSCTSCSVFSLSSAESTAVLSTAAIPEVRLITVAPSKHSLSVTGQCSNSA